MKTGKGLKTSDVRVNAMINEGTFILLNFSHILHVPDEQMLEQLLTHLTVQTPAHYTRVLNQVIIAYCHFDQASA
jgi:hypothetical protein